MSDKSLLNIDNLKLGYVGAFGEKEKPTGDAKLVSEQEKRKFVKKLKLIADKYDGLTPEDFLNIMIKENGLYNGDVLLLDQKSQSTTNDKGGRARGLIQFVPSTAEYFKLNQEDLATISPSEQLDFVDKFFAEAPKGSLKNYGDLYTYTFQPAAMGKGDDYVVGDANSKNPDSKKRAEEIQRYESNEDLDKDGDGKITKGEFAEHAQENIPSDNISNLFSKVTPEQYEENNKKIAADTFIEDTRPVGVDTPFTPLFQESVLNPNLRTNEKGKLIGGDKYVTKVTDPNGVTREIFTNSPLQEKNILGETFYSEKGGNRIFKLTDEYEKGNYVFKDYETTTEFNNDFDSKRPYKTINGTPGKGGVEDFKTADERMNHITTTAFEKVLDDRLEGLTQKAKTESGLNQKEFQEAKKAYDLKEGFYEKRQEDWAERVDEYHWTSKAEYKYKDKKRKNYIENNKFKNDFAKNVLFPEAEKRMNAAEALQDEALQEAEIAFSNGEITKEQFNVAKKTNKTWHNENDSIIKTMGAYRYNMDHDKSAASKDNPFFTYKDINGNTSAAVKGRPIAGENLAMGNIDWIEKQILGKYEPVLSEEEKAEATAKDNSIADPAKNKVDKSTSGNNAGGNNTGGNNTGGANPPANNVNPEADEVDKSGMVGEDAKTNSETAAYLDEDYLLKQNKLDQETIDFIKGQKEFNAELPEEEADYSNLLGNITDISKGLIGAAGAMEEVPEYETGDMYNQSVNDLTRMKDQGLSKQELDYATGNADKAFAYGMAQYRGTNAASALVGAGQQAAILQDQYGKISAADRGVRRQNMQNFVQGAVRDEDINRTKFQDKFTQTMLNKKEGAALARDAYTNMNERAQFEKQYGKNSQYSKLMNEQMLSLRENRQYAKQSRANTKQESINRLEQNKLDRQAKIDKNKATS